MGNTQEIIGTFQSTWHCSSTTSNSDSHQQKQDPLGNFTHLLIYANSSLAEQTIPTVHEMFEPWLKQYEEFSIFVQNETDTFSETHMNHDKIPTKKQMFVLLKVSKSPRGTISSGVISRWRLSGLESDEF